MIIKKIKQKIRDYIISNIYQITTSKDYIQVVENKVYQNNILLDKMKARILIEEARFLIHSSLYKSIKANRNYIAQQEMIKRGELYVDALKAVYLITIEDMKLIEMLANIPLDKLD